MADRDWVKVFSLAQKKYPRLRSIPLSEINIETSPIRVKHKDEFGREIEGYSETYPKQFGEKRGELFNPHLVNRELEWNPYGGEDSPPVKSTIEIFPRGKKITDEEAINLMAGELMHLLPEYDKKFSMLKDKYRTAKNISSVGADRFIRGNISPLNKKEEEEWGFAEQYFGNKDSNLAMEELKKYMANPDQERYTVQRIHPKLKPEVKEALLALKELLMSGYKSFAEGYKPGMRLR